jgi:tight adherence protein B
MNVTFLAALFVGAGLLMVILGIAQRSSGRREHLRQLLEVELEEPTRSPEALSDLMERAGAYAEKAMGKSSNTAVSLRGRLSQAGSNLKPGEFVAIVGIASVIMAVLGAVLGKSVLVGLLMGVATPVVGIFYLKNRARKRLVLLETQLPAVLQMLAGSLDSGASLLLALELAGEEGDPPLATELNRVIAETRVGRPILESLEAMADRIGSKDVSWTVEAIRIQHQTGGRLADTLRVLADFMRARVEVRGEVRALSAEARISGKVLTGMPILIGAFLFFFNRSYLDPLLTTAFGWVMLGAAGVGLLLGTLWMRRMIQVEV